MAAQYTLEYLAALRRGVDRFEQAFDFWMDTQSETDRIFMPGLVERVLTKEEADPEEVRRRELDVAEAAGLAAKAVQVTGSYMVVQGLRGPVDPISNWRNMTMPKAFLTPGEVWATCAAIRGRLEGLELDAQAGQEMGYLRSDLSRSTRSSGRPPRHTGQAISTASRRGRQARPSICTGKGNYSAPTWTTRCSGGRR